MSVSRSTLYRWEKEAEPKSRRPHSVREPAWTPTLARAVEELRPRQYHLGRSWPGPRQAELGGVDSGGKRKLVALLRRGVVRASVSTVGRILRKLMDRGVVTPVPTLRRNPAARRVRFNAKERYARRLPKGLKPTKPGELFQIVGPDCAIKHVTAYDPVAKCTVGRVSRALSVQSSTSLLNRFCAEAPFPIRGTQVDGGSEFKAEFGQACADKGLTLFVLPPKRPQLNGAVERAQGSWRYEFYRCFDLPHRIDKLQGYVDAFAHRYNHHRPHQALGDRTQPSISQPSAAERRRLICPELGHFLTQMRSMG